MAAVRTATRQQSLWRQYVRGFSHFCVLLSAASFAVSDWTHLSQAKLVTALLASMMEGVPDFVLAISVGDYLGDGEARQLARTSRRILQSLRSYRLKQQVPLSRLLEYMNHTSLTGKRNGEDTTEAAHGEGSRSVPVSHGDIDIDIPSRPFVGRFGLPGRVLIRGRRDGESIAAFQQLLTDRLAVATTIRAIEFDWTFNDNLPPLPQRLESLRFLDNYDMGECGQFNRPIPADWLPDSLFELKLSDAFDQPLGSLVLPPRLRVLVLGCAYSHSVRSLRLPASLITFDAGGSPDLPTHLPASLLRIRLNAAVMRDTTLMQLVAAEWPSSLGQLDFSPPLWPSGEQQVPVPTNPDEEPHPEDVRIARHYVLGGSQLAAMRLPASLRRLQFPRSIRLASIERFPFPASLTRLSYGAATYTHLCPPAWPNAPCLLPSSDSVEEAQAHAIHYLTLRHHCSKSSSISHSSTALVFLNSIPHSIASAWPASVRELNLMWYTGPAAELLLPPLLEKLIFSPAVDEGVGYSFADLHLPDSLLEFHIGHIDSLISLVSDVIQPVAVSSHYLLGGLLLPENLRVFSFPSEFHHADSLEDLPLRAPSSLRALNLWNEAQWERQAWLNWPLPHQCLVYLHQPEGSGLSPIIFWPD